MKRIERPIACYVTDRRSLELPAGTNRETALIERVSSAVNAGMNWIQIRERDLEARVLFDLACSAVAATRLKKPGRTDTHILLNDRLDVAWAAGATGVHLGETSLPVEEVARAKHRAGDGEFLVGASCHSLEGAHNAARDAADYIFFGPIFTTPSKAAFGPPQGLGKLAEVCRAVSIPVLAIGGITRENAAACLDAGAAGIAAIRLFQQTPDLAGLLDELLTNTR